MSTSRYQPINTKRILQYYALAVLIGSLARSALMLIRYYEVNLEREKFQIDFQQPLILAIVGYLIALGLTCGSQEAPEMNCVIVLCTGLLIVGMSTLIMHWDF